jgi:hypothetical protein
MNRIITFTKLWELMGVKNFTLKGQARDKISNLENIGEKGI